jgi:membrane-associated PAP2 superfamily phosphatase
MLTLRDWRSHVGWPLLAFTFVLGLLFVTNRDPWIAHQLFFDPVRGWLGAGHGAWWARTLIHHDGGLLVRSVMGLTIAAFLCSFRVARLAPWRRELMFAVIGMLAVVALVGALKALTNVDCPWDLEGFGGHRAYTGLFGHRAADLPRAQCFPGGHSGSAFALLAIYFSLRNRARRASRVALAAAVVLGMIFAFGQEARGAHFLAHDVTSAAIAWFALVWLYSKMLAPSANAASQIETRERIRQHAGQHAADDVPGEA